MLIGNYPVKTKNQYLLYSAMGLVTKNLHATTLVVLPVKCSTAKAKEH